MLNRLLPLALATAGMLMPLHEQVDPLDALVNLSPSSPSLRQDVENTLECPQVIRIPQGNQAAEAIIGITIDNKEQNPVQDADGFIQVSGWPPGSTTITGGTNPIGVWDINQAGSSANLLFNGDIIPVGKTDLTITIQIKVDAVGNVVNVWFETTPVGTNPTCDIPVEMEPGPALSDANISANGTTDDPVSTYTGELTMIEPLDLFFFGPFSLFFGRNYASLLERDGRIQSTLGPNWSHTFDDKIIPVDSATVEVVGSRGRVTTFEKQGSDWTQTDHLDTPLQLVDEPGGFALANPRTQRVLHFDADGRLTGIEDGHGNTLTLTYDADGLLQTVSDGLGRVLTFTYNAEDLLTELTDGTRTVRYGYTDGLLTRYTDALGNETTYVYDAANPVAGLLTDAVRPSGFARYTQTFDAEGRVTTQADALGSAYHLVYDADRTTITGPLGYTFDHVHSAEGLLTSFTDSDGGSVHMDYDTEGHRNRITDRLGAVTTFVYDPTSGLRTATTEANGAQMTFTYTERATGPFTMYDLTALTFADGTSITASYDASGNPTSTTDRAGSTWTYTYNHRGQVLSVTNSKGGVWSYTYNGDGTLATAQNPDGNTASFTYDTLFRLSAITHPDGNTTSFAYDAMDRLLSVTDERGETLTFSYDANGNLTAWTDASSNVTRYAYDAMDRLVQTTDRLGNVSSAAYDGLGRLTSTTDGNGNTRTFGYDALNNLTSITDEEGQTVQFDYDAEGVIRSVANPSGETTRFTTNEMGWITQVASPLLNTFTIAYDLMGRPTSAQDPLGQSTRYDYDARGLVLQMSLPGGASASYGRDGMGLLTGVTDPEGGLWPFTHDSQGRMTNEADPLGRASSYGYDSRSRLDAVTLPGGMGATYEYDASSHLTGLLYGDGTDVDYTYNANGWMTNATGVTIKRDNEGFLTETNGLAVTHDAEGRLTSLMLPAGEVRYTYDRRGLVTKVEEWLGGQTSFAYDAAGRLTSTTRPNGVTTSYTYDAESRITGIEEADGSGKTAATLASSVLVRDARGFVTTAIREVPQVPLVVAGSEDWTFDAASQVERFTYDALGRRTADAERTYTWDGASHLTGYTKGTRTVSFTYDAFGQRLTRTQDGVTRSYVWNYALGLPSVSVEQEGLSDRRYYVHTPDGALLYSIEATDGNRRYYHFDETGNTLFLTGEAGEVLAAYAYTPYGTLLPREDRTDNAFTWQGRFGIMQEDSTNFYYIRARYYDSSAGRFISHDPVRSVDARNLNPYQYAWNNPQNRIDPTGLDVMDPWIDFLNRIIYDVLRSKSIHDVFFKGSNELAGSITMRVEPEDFNVNNSLDPWIDFLNRIIDQYLLIQRIQDGSFLKGSNELAGSITMRVEPEDFNDSLDPWIDFLNRIIDQYLLEKRIQDMFPRDSFEPVPLVPLLDPSLEPLPPSKANPDHQGAMLPGYFKGWPQRPTIVGGDFCFSPAIFQPKRTLSNPSNPTRIKLNVCE